MTDYELIEQFRGGDDRAFTELVGRHAAWVREAARRRVGDVHLAEDVTQGVFILLARKAGSIKRGMVVSAWLFQAVRYCSSSALRGEGRRKHHEKEAAAMRSDTRSAEAGWRALVPLLDESVARLGRRDREAVLLRFYEQKQFAQVGAELGISEEGARKRVSRAIERLRSALLKKGVLLSAEALPAAMLAGLVTSVGTGGADAIGTAALAAARAKGAMSAADLMARGAEKMLRWARIKMAAAICGTAIALSGISAAAIVAQTRSGEVAKTPATMPAVDVAKLVQEVKDSQAWLARVDSFHAKFEGESVANPDGVPPGPPPKSTAPPNNLRAIGKKIMEFSKANSTTQPASQSIKSIESLEVAFDGKRMYTRQWTTPVAGGEGTGEIQIWDGKMGMIYSRVSNGSEEYGLYNTAKPVAQFFGGVGIWGRNGQKYWWSDANGAASDLVQSPEDYHLRGREVFHGVDCYLLDHDKLDLNQLYIGVADHRLYGIVQPAMPDSTYSDGQRIRREIAGDMGKTVRNNAELAKWVKSLSPDKLRQLEAEESKRLRALSVPWSQSWCAEHREVAPGCLLPGVLGQDSWDHDSASKPYVEQRTERKLSMVEVNRPLPEELFKYALKDGVIVWDSRERPALAYLQKADRSAAEWEAIRADGMRAKVLNETKQGVQKLYGTTAAEFPEGAKWVGGGAVKLADLRRKVVIVMFWADWRGLGEYVGGKWTHEWPDAAKVGGPNSEIVVVGVHAPTGDTAQVERAMKAYGMNFPVCIDVPVTGKVAAWGVMSEQFRVTQLPETYLIDQEGKIVGIFGWPEVIGKARTLGAGAGM